MGEITDKDREFFDQLIDRPADYIKEESIPEDEDGEKDVITKPDNLKLPDWYQPWMYKRVGWINGMPQMPTNMALKEPGNSRGRWSDGPGNK